MASTVSQAAEARQREHARNDASALWSVEHYLKLILHRKWAVLGVALGVAISTVLIVMRLPDIYTSETVILVDPQKVPETYVKPTVTGDVRNRLGTLSQQIMSATRLQKIIDSLNLYPTERKVMAREEVIALMRKDISVRLVTEFGGGPQDPHQDLQAFRIAYNGKDPRVVAQVTNQIASLFIEENLKARTEQAAGTNEFLQNQLQVTRKALEAQEAKLRDFKLKHVGEMPEQETSDLQIMGQLQSRLQLENEALNRAQQQKGYLQSIMGPGSAPVIDVDDGQQTTEPSKQPVQERGKSKVALAKARLATLLTRYTGDHPEVRRLRKQIEQEEADEVREALAKTETPRVEAKSSEPAAPPPASVLTASKPATPSKVTNPVLESQLQSVESEIAKHNQEQQRLSKLIVSYQSKLEAIPVHQQEITALVRDYEISKAHYSQLLEKQLSAETATQLEIASKGERFSILDPALPAERPSRPNRMMFNVLGCMGGLGLGLLFAVGKEFFGMTITTAEQITGSTGLAVLQIIPQIRTRTGVAHHRRIAWTAVSFAVLTLAAGFAFLFIRYRT